MKYLFILFFFLNSLLAAQIQIKGKIIDYNTGNPLPKANIILENGKQSGTESDADGEFKLDAEPGEALTVSYLGYSPERIELDSNNIYKYFTIELEPKIIPSQTVLVKATLGKEGISPAAFNKIQRKEIEKDYSVQDIPEFLSTLPSATFYSENGNGIGYNYLSIRGFDQRRISVSVNGIPQNDPEDHNVYWLDFPDILASTELIQVQRGSGSGVSGYPSIGGSINLITSTFSNEPGLNLSPSLGSYNTRKYSAEFSSGLIDSRYSIYTKISQILSSGYRNLAYVKFNSYHLSAVRYDEKFTTQINFYGGPIEDGLAYFGLPKFAVKDKELRKQNYSDWGADAQADTFTYIVQRRPEEIENFSQPHFELLNEYQINKNLTLNSALFLVIGKGFFDYDSYWSVFYDDYFRLKQDGFDSSYVPQNSLIRAMVENNQYGWIPRLSLKHTNGELIIGGEFRKHKSIHWGKIQYANNLPPNYDFNRYYYFYNGSKDIMNGFVNESYNLTESINLLGEVQAAYHKYHLYNEKYVGTDFQVSNLFFNPRFGINYKFFPELNSYFSFARVSREPRLNDYYDAAESSGGAVPQFHQKASGGYNFDDPFVKPETMNDFELGASYNSKDITLSINLFYMLFNNEIVKNGQLDRFGQPITGNAKQTVHQGIELSGSYKFTDSFEFFGNASYSRNKIEEGSTFIEYYPNDTTSVITELKLDGNRITGFPDFLANFGLSFNESGLYLKLYGKYLGDFFSDNYDKNLNSYLNLYPGFVSYDDNKNEAYFSMDFTGSYEFKLFNSLSPAKIFLQVNNIFDNLYSAYAIGNQFFPAAERNFLAGIELGL
ncbi:MAG TPA: TonB-dependent receptor [Ignavibacteriaceae bacterium]|nr:TonB-dependent receptor [Ignavibacteriaceae bacterium]